MVGDSFCDYYYKEKITPYMIFQFTLPYFLDQSYNKKKLSLKRRVQLCQEKCHAITVDV